MIARVLARRVLTLLAAVALLALSGWGAKARVVGVVFDNSGSMARRIVTPTFGLELLASTLDGREDRLLALQLSDYTKAAFDPASLTLERSIADHDALQATIDTIQRDWPNAQGNTPYGAVDLMLRRVVDTLRPGEAGFLVILSDGGFNDGLPTPAALREKYQAYAAELARKGATLRVDFLFIAFGGGSELEFVEKQHVRSNLLEVFNGNENDGKRDVRSMGDLLTALKAVVASVSQTAPTLSADYVRVDGSTLVVDSPLEIDRIITIATASRPQLPAHIAANATLPGGERLVYSAEMPRADRAAPGVIEVGETTQFAFRGQPLAAGTHRLTFDRPFRLGTDVTPLFQTSAVVELFATDRIGQRVTTLTSGAPYTLVARLMDGRPKPHPVALSGLRKKVTFKTSVADASGKREERMTIAGDQAELPFVAGPVGEMTAASTAALTGFVTRPSETIRLPILEQSVRIDTSVSGAESCDGCPDHTFRTTVRPDSKTDDVADVTVTPQAKAAGDLAMAVEKMPPWMKVVDDKGHALADGAKLPFLPGKAMHLHLRRVAGTKPSSIARASEPFRLAFKAVPPLATDAGPGNVAEGTINVAIAQPALSLRRADGPKDPAGRPLHSWTSIEQGDNPLVFGIVGALQPVAPAQFSAKVDGHLVRMDVAGAQGDEIVLRPGVRGWCRCLLWIDGGARRVELVYSGPGGLQSARATADIVVTPTTREIITCCLWLLFWLLALAWLIGTIVVAMRTARFPRGSVAEIVEGKQMARFEDLRKRNYTILRSSFWPVRRLLRKPLIPDERRMVEGLVFVARRGGAVLEFDRDTADFEVRGQDIRELIETNPRLASLRLNWREEIELRGPPRIRIKLLRVLGEAEQQWG